MKRARIPALALAAALALPACSWFREEIPGASCTANEDCFQGAGEVCDPQLKKCVIESDAAPLPDAPPPPPDAPPGPPDAALPDGGAVDAGGTDA